MPAELAQDEIGFHVLQSSASHLVIPFPRAVGPRASLLGVMDTKGILAVWCGYENIISCVLGLD